MSNELTSEYTKAWLEAEREVVITAFQFPNPWAYTSEPIIEPLDESISPHNKSLWPHDPFHPLAEVGEFAGKEKDPAEDCFCHFA